jgi:hypothetical protein
MNNEIPKFESPEPERNILEKTTDFLGETREGVESDLIKSFEGSEACDSAAKLFWESRELVR